MADRATAPRATDKLAFLLALVPYLIDQVRVTVDEAAAHFGISADDMRKSVTLIAMSGTPGAVGTYTHETLFDIDWDDFEQRDVIRFRRAPMDDKPRFSAREAAALLAGLQRVASLTGFAGSVDVAGLMAKLARGASSTPAPLAVRAGADDEVHALLGAAIIEHRRVRIDYVTTRGDRELREVDPIRLDGVDDAWYLHGWCLTRDAERTFLLDRMASVELLGDADRHDATADRGELFRSSADDLKVTIALPTVGLPLIADYRGPDDAAHVDNDRAVITLAISHWGILGRIAARLAGSVEILEPAEARSAVAEWARAALAADAEQDGPNSP